MTSPSSTVYQMPYQNPHASEPLLVPVEVVCNTPDDELHENIRINSKRDLPWAQFAPAHEMVAVMCGGGPSLADHIEDIRDWQKAGATIFAMNGASQFLRAHGISVTYQVIADAKQETSTLVDPWAVNYMIASQAHPDTFAAAIRTGRQVTLWHMLFEEGMERLFPEERRLAGGYALVSGGAAVGNLSMCLAYVRGYRRFEVYGYDSSNRGSATHAYSQPMNLFLPCMPVKWADTEYVASLAMKMQAERFQITGRALQGAGCTIAVHGDGLLPAMWNTKEQHLAERDKYRLLWQTDTYRNFSPGEQCVPLILEHLRPNTLVLDFGCGTGRASVELVKAGLPVFLIDFADNCRDQEAIGLPFLEWDLTKPIPCSAYFGICTDVMEHLPPEDVERTVVNIMAAARSVFFQISSTADHCGALIGHHLHLTVQPHAWWLALFTRLGYAVSWSQDFGDHCCFVIRRDTARS